MRGFEPGVPAGSAAHETTTRHVGALYPLLRDTGLTVPGPLIGVDLLGGPFVYDPFELYAAGRLTNPNAVVFGQIGRGKSALIKTYLFRQLAFGRSAFVLDPKGEYGALAAAAGVEPLRLRPAGPLRINPLDLAVGGEVDLAAERLQLLEALAASTVDRSLSPRERQVMNGLIAGLSNKLIARDYDISPRTIEVYRANVMTKMQANSLSELVRLAMRAGLLND